MSDLLDSKMLFKLHNIHIEILDEIVKICDRNKLDYCLIGGTLLGAIRHKGFIPWDDDLDIAMPRDSYNKFILLCKFELGKEFLLDSFIKNRGYSFSFIKIRKRNTIYEETFLQNRDVPKGVWVDIFPLDNVKHQESNLQVIQAKLTNRVKGFIMIKQNYKNYYSLKSFILFNLFRVISVRAAFKIQEKVMTFWNNKKTRYFANLGSNYNYVKQTIPKDKYYPFVKVEFEGKLYNAPHDWDYILQRIYGDYMQLPPIKERVTHKPARIDLSN